MKIEHIINETTTAGAVSSVAMPLGQTQRRTTENVKGLIPAEKVLKAKKKGPYANSLSEGKEKKPVVEADLQEDDLIIIPGQSKRLKAGFIPKAQDRTDHEVEMAKADLLALYKNTKSVLMCIKDISEDEGLEGWVQEKIIKASDYMNTLAEYFEGKKIQEMSGGVIAAGGVGEGVAEGAGEQKYMAVYNKHIGNPSYIGKPITYGGKVIYVTASSKEEASSKFVEIFNRSQVLSSFIGKFVVVPKDVDSEQGVAEGKFTINAKTGAKLDPRTGVELPPKEKPMTMKQMFAQPKQPKLTLDDVWLKIQSVVSNIYPDGDPIDHLAPWLKKHGIRDFKIGEILDRAAKKNGYKDLYDYWESMGDLPLSEQGVAEGGILKSIKRGLQGWGTGDAPTPQELVRRNKGHSDDTIKALAIDTRKVIPHSPADLQKRVVDREMKRRGLGEEGVAEGTLTEKAKSTAQQKFFGMAHAMQKGKKIPGASKELKDVTKSMSKSDVTDFAKTKHKDLPSHVKKEK